MYVSITVSLNLRCQRPEHGVLSVPLSQLEGCVSLLVGRGQRPLTSRLVDQEAREMDQTQTHGQVKQSFFGLSFSSWNRNVKKQRM